MRGEGPRVLAAQAVPERTGVCTSALPRLSETLHCDRGPTSTPGTHKAK